MAETSPPADLQGRLAQGRAGGRAPQRAEVKQAAAIAKLYTSEAAVTATRIATQVFGGNGFMEEYPVARFYRDAKILEIGEGTSEVQRMVIARRLGLPS
jgi:short/branched chain acyl-CoA dehydrogenase